MAITHEDVQELKTVFDDRYVLQSTCTTTQEQVSKKLAYDDKRIEKLFDRLNLWNKLLWAIASASIGSLVVAFFELILK